MVTMSSRNTIGSWVNSSLWHGGSQIHTQIGQSEPHVEERHIDAIARALPVEFINPHAVHPLIALSLTQHDTISAFHAVASTCERDNTLLAKQGQPQDPIFTRLTTLYYRVCQIPIPSTPPEKPLDPLNH
ncbi:MAG: hypothetical protein WC353_06745 [Candidatus Peribacter sp.]|jgi:hypothetical protein